jgi:copper chaperone CopZ
MPTREIFISIEDDGRVSIFTKGFRGKVCISEVEKLLKSLEGIEAVTTRLEKTAEYFIKEEERVCEKSQ